MVSLTPAILRKGTPLEGWRLSVLSYNLLAPLYVRPIDERTGDVQAFAAFEWAEPAAKRLDWAVRRPRLEAELMASRADVICLQEVQYEPDPTTGEFKLPSWLQLAGYTHCIPPQKDLAEIAARNLRVLRSAAAVGNAVLVRDERLEIVESAGKKDANTKVQLAVKGRGDLAGLGLTAVASVHLDAKDEEQRVKALAKCIEHASSLGTREVIICGDMNSELLRGSCVSAFLADEPEPTAEELERECSSALRLGDSEGEEAGAARPTVEQVEGWRALWSLARSSWQQGRVALARVPTRGTRAGYAHGKREGPCVSWALDHILYTPRTLRLHAHWASLEDDADSAAAGLPSLTCPSDHLPIAAVFEPVDPPVLAPHRAAELIESLGALRAAQMEERATLTAEVEAEQRELEVAEQGGSAAVVSAAAEANEEMQVAKGKQKSKKKGPPSAAMQALLRGSRERQKALKLAQREARAAFMLPLDELQRDALEGSLLNQAEWVERGD